MTKAAAEVVRKALALEEDERAEIGSRVLKSLEIEDPGESGAWVAELEKRAAELESGAVQGVPWEVLRESLMRHRRLLPDVL